MLQVYCGPVPQIDNGFAVAATNVSYRGMASYQCYAGFGFPSGNPIETIVCTSEGDWSFTPVCQGMKMKFLLLHLASSRKCRLACALVEASELQKNNPDLPLFPRIVGEIL